MIPYERQERILEILKEKKLVKIDELSEILNDVSVSTLRRDIKELEKNGKVESMYGGAVKYLLNTDELPIAKKSLIHMKEKEVIADLAADLVHDGETVYIDSGSTATLLMDKLIRKDITIYTTNTSIFTKVLEDMKAEVIILSGTFNSVTSSLSGPFTELSLQNIYFDQAFLGVNGVDIVTGASTPNISEAVKKKLVRDHSRHTYLLCDSSKFGLTANVKAFDINGITIISDKKDEDLAEVAEFVTP
ncbi:DeoR/GlpR family DNA-binding transcription regulator [Ligilactobacillus saerimneri]